MTMTGPEGTAWSCVRGGAGGSQGQVLHHREVGMGWAAQDCGHGPELLELKEHPDTVLRLRAYILHGAVRSQELGLRIPVGAFQLGIF